MTETRELAERWEGQLSIAFVGWDADPRETAEIRAYFTALTEAWPNWRRFAEKVGDTVPHVLRLRCRGRIVALEQDLVGCFFADLGEVKREGRAPVHRDEPSLCRTRPAGDAESARLRGCRLAARERAALTPGLSSVSAWEIADMSPGGADGFIDHGKGCLTDRRHRDRPPTDHNGFAA